MPVLFSYDVSGTDSQKSNRIQCLFERLGWQGVGGSSYRYPPLGTDPAVPEDWFNCVVPALMAFRAMILHDPALSVGKFSLDVQTSTGHDAANAANAANPGKPIAPAQVAQFAQPSNPAFGAQHLENWINAATNQFPYP